MRPRHLSTIVFALSLLTPVLATADASEASHAIRLREVERRIDELKEKIRVRQTKLALLTDSIFDKVTAAARADIGFENDMSGLFKLQRIVVLYDGAPLASKTDEKDGIAAMKEIPLYGAFVQPGEHTLQVLLEYRGNGDGIFSYLNGYKFEVRSTRSFTAVEGRTLSLRIVGYEQGGPLTPFEEKPAVRYVEKVQLGVGAKK